MDVTKSIAKSLECLPTENMVEPRKTNVGDGDPSLVHWMVNKSVGVLNLGMGLHTHNIAITMN